MARAQKAQKSQKFAKSHGPSRKSANALGYAKRRSLKPQATSSISDVYEYQQEKVRRAKVKLQLSKDERMEFGAEGSGSEDGDDDALRRARDRRPRLVGEEDDDDNVIDEDDDEEIDSDAAFEESDEERFAGFSFASDVRI